MLHSIITGNRPTIMSNNSTFDDLMEQKEEVLQQLEEISKGEKRIIRSMMMIYKKLSTHGTSQ